MALSPATASVLLLLILRLAGSAQDFTFQTFRVPYPPNNPLDSNAQSINNHGIIAGNFQFTLVGFVWRGYKRYPNGAFEYPIRYPGSTGNTRVSGINNLGQIVGSYGGTIDHKGFLLSGDVYSTIEVPFEGATTAIAINDRGDILGESFGYNGNGAWRDFLIADGVVTTVNVPGTHPSRSSPRGLAWDRTVIGDFRIVPGRRLGYVRGPNGNFFGINIAGARHVVPYGINNVAGKIVGAYQDSNFATHGFIYDYKSDLGAVEVMLAHPGASAADTAIPIRTVQIQAIDLPGIADCSISGINAHGVITGNCVVHGNNHGFVGTPTPSLSQTKP